MQERKIKIEVLLEEEFLKDIVVCIAEDFGYNQWRQVSRYRPNEGIVYVHDVEDDDETYTVNLDTIALGIKRIANGNLTNNTIREAILNGVKENDAGNIDSEASDAILQAALFNKLIYG